MNFLQKIKGWKKITAAFLGLLSAILGPELIGLDPAVVNNIITVLSFYLVGQGAADLGEHMSAKTKKA